VTVDLPIVVGSLVVGFAVGLTGMGGGALMTPVLVILFRVQPLAAVSSDLIASLVMKPFGSVLHVQRRTVRWDLVGWLCLGSVPAAFLGAVFLHALGPGALVQRVVSYALGSTLVVAAAAVGLREWMTTRRPGSGEGPPPAAMPTRCLATLAIGVVGGFIVGVTSAGSGTLIVVALMFLHPRLRTREIVGTDLVQAIPLVAAAALGHVIFGSFQLGLTTSIVIGSIPGTVVGAWISARADGRAIRPLLAVVLVASALKLLDVGTAQTALAVAALAALGGAALVVARLSAPALADRSATREAQA
jgi:uncharacterized membrane protein YfcA